MNYVIYYIEYNYINNSHISIAFTIFLKGITQCELVALTKLRNWLRKYKFHVFGPRTTFCPLPTTSLSKDRCRNPNNHLVSLNRIQSPKMVDSDSEFGKAPHLFFYRTSWHLVVYQISWQKKRRTLRNSPSCLYKRQTSFLRHQTGGIERYRVEVTLSERQSVKDKYWFRVLLL